MPCTSHDVNALRQSAFFQRVHLFWKFPPMQYLDISLLTDLLMDNTWRPREVEDKSVRYPIVGELTKVICSLPAQSGLCFSQTCLNVCSNSIVLKFAWMKLYYPKLCCMKGVFPLDPFQASQDCWSFFVSSWTLTFIMSNEACKGSNSLCALPVNSFETIYSLFFTVDLFHLNWKFAQRP